VPLFIAGDVRNRYIGRAWESTEWIDTRRDESTLAWLSELSDAVNLAFNVHHTQHKQDSFYEGFIYKATDKMTYIDSKVNYALNAQHLLTIGVDRRDEKLDSQSNSVSEIYVSDAFDYLTRGIFIQDTWNLDEKTEIVAVLRGDAIEADFTDPKKVGVEIDEQLVSPRVDARIIHTDRFTSRISYGHGYRGPLSFFESDHGILDAGQGFLINIDELERSKSFNYAVSFTGEILKVTSSVAFTQLDNMATLGENDEGVPVLDQATTQAKVIASDIALTYSVTQALSTSAVLEWINYNATLKSAFGVVPIERRLGLELDWHLNRFETHLAATWVGSRDLLKFGTAQAPTFDAAGNLPKSTTAPSYWVFDLQSRYSVNEDWSLYAGAKNLLDYTQVNDMETPLFYEDGGFDVAHIYGPLRGREFYAGLKWTF
jgi:outer membrane receptor for ferrienterochelin and colicin